MNIGANIKRIREERGLSQRELAAMINSSQSAIARFETNSKKPSVDLLISIIEALETTPNEILCEKDT